MEPTEASAAMTDNHYKEEEHEMESDGFTSKDAVLWGAMNNMGNRGGYGGGGAWGNGYGYGIGGHGVFAGPGSNAVRLDRNAQMNENQADCTRALFGQAFGSIRDSFENATRASEFDRVCSRLSAIDTRNSDQRFQSELRIMDQLASLREKQAQDAAASALCCCKLEAQAAQNYGELKAQNAVILAKLDSNKEISELRAQLQTQQIFATCGCGCGGGVKPCPPL